MLVVLVAVEFGRGPRALAPSALCPATNALAFEALSLPNIDSILRTAKGLPPRSYRWLPTTLMLGHPPVEPPAAIAPPVALTLPVPFVEPPVAFAPPVPMTPPVPLIEPPVDFAPPVPMTPPVPFVEPPVAIAPPALHASLDPLASRALGLLLAPPQEATAMARNTVRHAIRE